MQTRNSIAAALAATALAAFTTVSEARIFAADAYPADFIVHAASPVLVPITSEGGTTLSFRTSTLNKTLIITFNAVCGDDSGNLYAYVDIDILVDGKAVPPTAGSLDAFCSSNAEASPMAGMVRASITTSVVVPSWGAHSLQVRAKSTGNSIIQVGHSAIVLHD